MSWRAMLRVSQTTLLCLDHPKNPHHPHLSHPVGWVMEKYPLSKCKRSTIWGRRHMGQPLLPRSQACTFVAPQIMFRASCSRLYTGTKPFLGMLFLIPHQPGNPSTEPQLHTITTSLLAEPREGGAINLLCLPRSLKGTEASQINLLSRSILEDVPLRAWISSRGENAPYHQLCHTHTDLSSHATVHASLAVCLITRSQNPFMLH